MGGGRRKPEYLDTLVDAIANGSSISRAAEIVGRSISTCWEAIQRHAPDLPGKSNPESLRMSDSNSSIAMRVANRSIRSPSVRSETGRQLTGPSHRMLPSSCPIIDAPGAAH